MRELFSSEPNLIRLYTSIQGVPHTPIDDTVKAKLMTGNYKDKMGLRLPPVDPPNDPPVSNLPVIDEYEDMWWGDEAPLPIQQVDNGEWEIMIPQNLLFGQRYAVIETQYELEHFGTIRDRRRYDVSRRLFDFQEFNELLEEEQQIDYSTYTFIETDVRKVIETYCNQTFNHWHGTQVVTGYEGHIAMPETIERIDKVLVGSSIVSNYQSEVHGYEISELGKSIYHHERNKTVSFFHSQPGPVNYTVKGLWGHTTVPAGVHQAALELARGFMCDDMEYRRRYIDNITNGDMRIGFSKRAYYDTTGNPIADQLLEPHRMFLMGAV